MHGIILQLWTTLQTNEEIKYTAKSFNQFSLLKIQCGNHTPRYLLPARREDAVRVARSILVIQVTTSPHPKPSPQHHASEEEEEQEASSDDEAKEEGNKGQDEFEYNNPFPFP